MNALHAISFPRKRTRPGPLWSLLAALALAAMLSGQVAAEEKAQAPPAPAADKAKAPALDKPVPENVEDLRALQQRVKAVLKKVIPATVGIRSGGASGSGVIIDKDGHVLTAGHVSGRPERDVTIILPNGKTLKAKTLGANHGIDSGLIKITDKGEFPYVEMGKASDLKKGQWVVATGHPGGFRPGRTPVVRLGRVLDATRSIVRTDCSLVGGDSGGPLFDLEGRVVGIHSRIGGAITANIHVPVDTYRDTWDRLVAAEVWGGRFGLNFAANMPYMGIRAAEEESAGCRVGEVVSGSPAEKAGLKPGDVLLTFDGQKLASFDELFPKLSKKKIGDKVVLEVRRGDDTVKVEVVLGKRQE